MHKKQKLAKENIQVIITKLPHFPISQGLFEKKLHEVVYFKAFILKVMKPHTNVSDSFF